jgi:NAD(P)-dependent dehydrogenase (short-subunit alcohol dehydrogenase family)
MEGSQVTMTESPHGGADAGYVVPDLTDVPIGRMMSLEGRVAVVTGAARGIGLAIVKRLAEAGATVVVTDVGGAQEGAESLDGAVRWRVLDVTDSAAVDTCVGSIVDELGRIDIWVNNAGIYPSAPVLDLGDDAWHRVIDTNLSGTFYCSRAAARVMVRQPPIGAARGVIINVTSVSGYRGRAGLAHYSSSKHAVRGLTRSLAVELGRSGIRVLGIAPTMVATPGTEAAAAGRATSQQATSQLGGRPLHSTDVYERLPLGRSGVPDDVARVVLFATSDLAALMTGSTIAVDAGQMSI